MFPDDVDYYRADSVDEALDLLAAHADEATELLAGGHSLLPMMKTGLASPDALVDVSGVDAMRGVRVEGDTLVVGAAVRYRDLLDAEAARERAPALVAAAGRVGDRQVRNRGTVGGNLAHADPASDLPGAALASAATLVARGPDGEREIDVDDFFTGLYGTALDDDEILTRVEVPSAPDAVGAYAKKPSPSSGYAMVGVAVLAETDGGTVDSVRVAANGALDHGVRLGGVEDALDGGPLDADAAGDAAARATDGIDTSEMMDDVQAGPEFRARLLEVYTRRALTDAADQVAGSGAAAD